MIDVKNLCVGYGKTSVLSGASLLLLDREAEGALGAISERAVCRNLATSPRFTDAFMERMMLEPVDDWA